MSKYLFTYDKENNCLTDESGELVIIANFDKLLVGQKCNYFNTAMKTFDADIKLIDAIEPTNLECDVADLREMFYETRSDLRMTERILDKKENEIGKLKGEIDLLKSIIVESLRGNDE